MKNKIKSFIGYILIISLFIFFLKKCSDLSHQKNNLKNLNSDLFLMKKEQKERLYYANKIMEDISFKKHLNENKIDSLNFLINNLNKNKIIYKTKKVLETKENKVFEYLNFIEKPQIKDSFVQKIVYIKNIDTVFIERIVKNDTLLNKEKRKRFSIFNIFKKRN
jgi:hypothetical protein